MKSVRNLVWWVPSRNNAADVQHVLTTEPLHQSLAVFDPFNAVVGPITLAVEDEILDRALFRSLGVEDGFLVWGSRVLRGSGGGRTEP